MSDAKPLTPTEIGTAVGRAETLIASLGRLGHILKRPGPAPNAEGIADAAAVISRVADEMDAFLPRLYTTIDQRDAEIVSLRKQLASAQSEADFRKRREADIIEACERVADGGQYRADIVSAIMRIRVERDAWKALALALDRMGPNWPEDVETKKDALRALSIDPDTEAT